MVHCVSQWKFEPSSTKMPKDINICCWDGKKSVAQSVYDNSQFLQRSNTVNLKEEILNVIKDLYMGKFLHLGIDPEETRMYLTW